jgi:hypothetical protein
MEFVCFGELTDLEKAAILTLTAAGVILFALGLFLAFRRGLWRALAAGKVKEYSASLPAPLACILLGLVFLGVEVWWLHKTFPAQNFSFSQKAWTLGEIKERLEDDSRLRIDLQGKAASFAIDRKVSGTCASDLMTSICDLYPSKLKCEHNSKSHTFIIALRP